MEGFPMKDTYVVYKGVRMTEQEAEERINEAYCNAIDKAREKSRGRSTSTKKAPAKGTGKK